MCDTVLNMTLEHEQGQGSQAWDGRPLGAIKPLRHRDGRLKDGGAKTEAPPRGLMPPPLLSLSLPLPDEREERAQPMGRGWGGRKCPLSISSHIFKSPFFLTPGVEVLYHTSASAGDYL